MTLFFRTIFCARMVSLSLQIGFHFLRAKTRRLVSMCVCVLWYYDDFFLILDDHNGSQQFSSFYSNQMVVLIFFSLVQIYDLTILSRLSVKWVASRIWITLIIRSILEICLFCSVWRLYIGTRLKPIISIWPTNEGIRLIVKMYGIHFSKRRFGICV